MIEDLARVRSLGNRPARRGPATTPTETLPVAPRRTATPGWPEIFAGSAVYAAGFLLVALLLPLIDDESTAGVIGLVVSGLIGLTALSAAVLLRIRRLDAFGFRRARARHLLAGAGLGLVAFAVGIVASTVYSALSGDVQNVQAGYQSAATTGWATLLVTLIAGSVITPIGEEAFFRGVVANALLTRHGAWIGVLASAAVFALAHGINPVLPVAFVVGVVAALLYRRTGSLWPGVVLHGVNNATALLVPAVLTLAGA